MEDKRTGHKRIVVIADCHCGHRAGLTPPEYQLNRENELDAKWRTIQEEQWNWYTRTMAALQPISLLLCNGDMVDGKGERCDGRDVIRHQRDEQVEMAVHAICESKAPAVSMVFGTRYHTRDWESLVAKEVGAKIGAHEWPEVNGTVIDLKHHIGGSSVPHGRATAIKRDVLWSKLWSEIGLQPKAHFLLRAHVHYYEATPYDHADGSECWAIICPALQGMGSEYGAERCSGLVSFGLVVIDTWPGGQRAWSTCRAKLKSYAAHTTKY